MDLDGIFDLLELVVDIIDLATDSSREKRYFEQEKYRKERQQEQVNWSRFNGLSEDVSVVDNELPRLRTERYVTPTSRTQMLAPEVSEPERTPISVKESYQTAYDKLLQRIEVELYMLVYLLQQEDGMISRDEARIIKRRLRPYRVDLKDEDITRLKQLKADELSIDTVIQMIKDYHIPENDLKDIFEKLHAVNRVTKRHDRIIKFMETHIFLELEMIF